MRSRTLSPSASSTALRALVLGLALGLTWTLAPSCSGKGSGGSGGGLGLLSDGTPCTTNAECQSNICASDATSGLAFCTDYCMQQSDCSTSSFPKGCCFPAQPGVGFCAIAALCPDQGDAGLGDPCPNHDECSPDLVCVYSSDNTVNECTRPCDATHGCDNLPSECCEPVGAMYNYCVIDNACAGGSTSGSTGGTTGGSSGGTTGTTGYPGGDAGPVTGYYVEDGTTVASTWGVLGAVGGEGDTVDIPPTTRDIQFDFPATLQPGVFHCDTTSTAADAGGVLAGVDTNAANSPDFSGQLSPTWQGLLIGLQCGSTVGGATDAVVSSIDLAVTSYTPGHLSTVDAGAIQGQVSGTAHWALTREGSTLDVFATFDTPLTAQ